MTNGDHVFIFHSDDEAVLRRSSPAGEIVVAGNSEEDQGVAETSKWRAKAAETERIRERSASFNSSISQYPDAPTHLWPDSARGISERGLRFFVIRCLAKQAPDPEKSQHQLEVLSDICCATWFLKCAREPIVGAADSILRKREKGPHKAGAEVEDAKKLAIITFVLGRDTDLRMHLEKLVWHSRGTSKTEIPIQCLREWIHERRKCSLHHIYNFFHQEIRRLHESHGTSTPVMNIYKKLITDADKLGGVNFWPGWLEHDVKKGKVLEMSPQDLIDHVLAILKQEVVDDREQIGAHKKSGPTPNGVTIYTPRSGVGGDFLNLFRSLRSTPEDTGAMAIRNVVKKVEEEEEIKWKKLEQTEIKDLTMERDAEQNEWVSAFLVRHQANGGIAAPQDPDSIEEI